MSVGLDFLLRGGWYALEQAGRLMTDASMLLEAGSHATAAGLALLSPEELAKSRKLFALWMRAAGGEEITRDQLDDEIDLTHVEKQRHGASSFSVPVDGETLAVLKGERQVAISRSHDRHRGALALGSAENREASAGGRLARPIIQ